MASELPEGAPEGRRIFGLKPRTALIMGGVVLGGALLFFWWRSKQSSSSSGASSSSASASAYSDAGQLDAIQAELDQLLQDRGSGSGSGGGTSGGGSGTGTLVDTTSTDPTAPAPTTGGGGTGTKTATKKPKPAMPAAHETKVTPTSVTLAWDKVANATGYRIRVTYQSKLVGAPHLVAGTSATISGLAPLRTYTFHVAAIGPGGASGETNGPAVKTK
jgi:hypothetical protein